MLQGRRVAIALSACAAIGLAFSAPALAEPFDVSGKVIELGIESGNNPLVHLTTKWVKHPKPGELRVVVTNSPDPGTANSMNVGGLVICRKNGKKKHYLGAQYNNVPSGFTKKIRKFPVRNPRSCKVEVTAVFDGTGSVCSGAPTECFSQPGTITVGILLKRR